MAEAIPAKRPLQAPAWVEIDVQKLRRNLDIIRRDMPAPLRWCGVVKDNAYGHGAAVIAKEDLRMGAAGLAVATVAEAMQLREAGVTSEILLFGERTPDELPYCLSHQFTCIVNDEHQASRLHELARKENRQATVHTEIDTGLSRYGVRWTGAAKNLEKIGAFSSLRIAGLMTHFAMSDELDKTFANEQLRRFQEVLAQLQARGVLFPIRHACNSGGYLDLPRAHFDMVRLGILPLGVYPSQVCRRLPDLAPIMQVKARVAALRLIQAGDHVGYGMRYTASAPRTIAVIPLGYGDGFPRVRNLGFVLIHGRRAPVVGGNAMDAMMVDVSEIPQVQQWDESVVLGEQNGEVISVHDLAAWGGTVSYDIMTKLSLRLPKIYVGESPSD